MCSCVLGLFYFWASRHQPKGKLHKYPAAQWPSRHTCAKGGSWNYGYTYDSRGNMLTMPHLSAMNWNRSNELSSVSEGTLTAHYQYSSGQRVRKYVDKGSIKEERIYLGSYEIYRKFTGSSLTPDIERTTVHVSDDSGRIAMLEILNDEYGSDGSLPVLSRYVYSNHLQSATLELDGTAGIISYEEYHPYGTTAYQASNTAINAVSKRYRYTGKERDEESGLYYHGARYYIPWLCRWTACDPLESKYAGMSPYNYSFNNPVMFNDPSGMEGERIYTAQGPEVTVSASKMKEGEHKQETNYIPTAGGTYTEVKDFYFHTGDEKHSRGWYGESEYVNMNTGVILGLIAIQDPGILRNTNPGIDSAIAAVANTALNFAEKNRGNISSDFLNLISKHGSELVRGFKERHGDAIYLSAVDPIADLLPGIVKGLASGLIGMAARTETNLTKNAINTSIATSRNSAIETTEVALKDAGVSLSKWEAGTAMRNAGAAYEKVLAEKLGSTGSFTMERIEIDGAFKNIWYEAKSGNYWEHTAMKNAASIEKAKSQFGGANALAKRQGFSYNVYSENAIPQFFKDYFNKKGITFFENFK